MHRPHICYTRKLDGHSYTTSVCTVYFNIINAVLDKQLHTLFFLLHFLMLFRKIQQTNEPLFFYSFFVLFLFFSFSFFLLSEVAIVFCNVLCGLCLCIQTQLSFMSIQGKAETMNLPLGDNSIWFGSRRLWLVVSQTCRRPSIWLPDCTSELLFYHWWDAAKMFKVKLIRPFSFVKVQFNGSLRSLKLQFLYDHS